MNRPFKTLQFIVTSLVEAQDFRHVEVKLIHGSNSEMTLSFWLDKPEASLLWVGATVDVSAYLRRPSYLDDLLIQRRIALAAGDEEQVKNLDVTIAAVRRDVS